MFDSTHAQRVCSSRRSYSDFIILFFNLFETLSNEIIPNLMFVSVFLQKNFFNE